MYETSYHRPRSLEEARILFQGADDPSFVAGGQTLIPAMKHRLASPSDIIDLSDLDDLKGIRTEGGTLTIGAASSHACVAGSGDVKEAIPALAALAADIGDPAVRHRGTIGGSLANNDPAADYPAAALALGATIHTSTQAHDAAAFFGGLFETALEEGEIVTRVDFPIPARAAYRKFANPASGYALVGAFVARWPDGSVTVAITGAGRNGVFRMPNMEAALSENFAPEAVENPEVDAGGLLADLHATADYRANLVRVMTARAVADCAA